jgi:hypothetical protein
MTKLMIKEQKRIEINCITCSTHLKDLLESVTNLIDEYGEDATISFDSGYESIDEYIECEVEREETAAEYSQRLKREKKQEDRERKEFERLKAKFGEYYD